MRLLAVWLLASVLLASCVQKKKESVQPINTSSLMRAVTVDEVIQTDSYTYLKVTESGNQFWMAVNRQSVEVGQKYYYDSALEMKDFKSKALDRTFETIYFVQSFSKEPISEKKATASMQEPQGKKVEAYNKAIDVEPVDGGVTIAKLYESKEDFSGKQVTVRGQIVKVNKNIMGRNWLHIQDGTNFDGKYDLTITSSELAEVGQVVTIEGTVTLDKDFGAGYFYDLIMENGSLVE